MNPRLKPSPRVKLVQETKSKTQGISKAPRIVACIPAYNKEKCIGPVVLKTLEFVDQVIVCDDGSEDLTGQIAAMMGATVITHERNMGYGAAIRSLQEEALRLGADIAVTLDGDGQHDPADIPQIVDAMELGDSDIVIGSRFVDGGYSGAPSWRERGIGVITGMVSNDEVRLTDAQSGMRAYNRSALESLVLTEDGMGVSTEILLKAIENGLKVSEIPVTRARADVTKDQVTVVIPVLNEEKAIGLVLDEVKAEGYDNILVVDGYSSDNSVKVAQGRKVMVIYQHGNGKTSALKTAIEHVTTPYILIMDGDYTYSGKDIERFLNHASRYAHIIGVRNRESIGIIHTFGNRVITRVFNVLFGVSLSDICSGMYLLKTEVAKSLSLDSNRFCAEVEITAQTVIEHEVTEVPISFRNRIGKQKLSTFKDGFQILSTIIGLARRYNPVFLFSVLSTLSIIPAFAVLTWVAYERLTTGIFHIGSALFGVMLLLLASLGFAVATLALLMKRMEFRLTRKVK